MRRQIQVEVAVSGTRPIWHFATASVYRQQMDEEKFTAEDEETLTNWGI